MVTHSFYILYFNHEEKNKTLKYIRLISLMFKHIPLFLFNYFKFIHIKMNVYILFNFTNSIYNLPKNQLVLLV